MAFRSSLSTSLRVSVPLAADLQPTKDALTLWLSRISATRSREVDAVELGHIKQLYATIPTRDGSDVSYPWAGPSHEMSLQSGHHLALFPPLGPLSTLNPDGTDSTWSSPPPFARRMWAGGRFEFNLTNELKVGEDVTCDISIEKVGLK
ncbi:hypothetical protein BOTBODRAFT_370183 [Botryobasidium botryosum FD-172 SS1]|uniref:Uncharacterized protein n=1 Tax=Botryobasidium botryosum (strain FD-172 SS1) TaxID=930990 RepID=A0A067MD96_BOTB1|nr:hypothetical protein BOTBODRAFT_370183 [Botryobasidium botryosum FD-172 SS1]